MGVILNYALERQDREPMNPPSRQFTVLAVGDGTLRVSNKTPISARQVSAAHIAGQVLGCAVDERPIQPLLPPASGRPKGDRPRPTDRACFAGILFALRSGMSWERCHGSWVAVQA